LSQAAKMAGVLIAPKKLGYIKTIKPLLEKINKALLIAGEN
jgi:hypothetical protein